MRIKDLLKVDSIELGIAAADKNAVIEKLVYLHDKSGNLTDKDAFTKDILAREEMGTTAIGNEIATPHAKSTSVKAPALSAITVPSGVNYDAPDGADCKLFFMIAATTDGDVHLEVLANLMRMMMDEEFTSKLKAAETPEEFLSIIEAKEAEKEAEAAPAAAEAPADEKFILAVTACPTGIAHTYMAAENLEKAGKEMGINIKVETNGSGGVKNALTADDIKNCDGVIIAADKSVETARFDGIPVLSTKVADGIHKPKELIEKVLSGDVPAFKAEKKDDSSAAASDSDSFGRRLYKHLMNGVSHMLPFVVAGGIFIAIAFLIDTIAGVKMDGNFGSGTAVSAWFKTIGGLSFGLMLPILAGFIAMSIADRPGFLVGIIGGLMAASGATFKFPGAPDWNSLFAGNMDATIKTIKKGIETIGLDQFTTDQAAKVGKETINAVVSTDKVNDLAHIIPAGFLGALLAGFLGGFIIKLFMKLCDKLPDALEGIKPVLLYPLAGLGIVAVMMCAVNPIMGVINTGLNDGLIWLNNHNLGLLLGFILAAMMAIDMGGPFNKAAYVFGSVVGLGMQNDTGYMIMAAVMIGGMVPPIAIALSTTLFKNRWTESERKSGPVNYIMGLSFITEGAIPYAASYPLKVIPACMIGSGVAGFLSWLFKCTLMAPHGGIFVVATIGHALMYLLALVIGSVVACAILTLLKGKNK